MKVLPFEKVEIGMIGEDYCDEVVTIIDKGPAHKFGESFVEELSDIFDEDPDECSVRNIDSVKCSLDLGNGQSETVLYTYDNGGVIVLEK